MKTEMQWLKEGVWLLPAPEGEDYEILIPGDSGAPSSLGLQLSSRVLPALPTLRTLAIGYIELFFSPAHPPDGSKWHFEAVDFGYPDPLSENAFRLCFSIEDDIYCEWSVLFIESVGRFFPVQFSRAQI